uniref:Uncharacterized protein n=1 Tax=Ditylenchus dipsaci TaxID=166011 RepID=A0A915EU10_9BILA
MSNTSQLSQKALYTGFLLALLAVGEMPSTENGAPGELAEWACLSLVLAASTGHSLVSCWSNTSQLSQ